MIWASFRRRGALAVERLAPLPQSVTSSLATCREFGHLGVPRKATTPPTERLPWAGSLPRCRYRHRGKGTGSAVLSMLGKDR